MSEPTITALIIALIAVMCLWVIRFIFKKFFFLIFLTVIIAGLYFYLT